MFSELLFCENEPSPIVSLWSWACFARSATDLLLVGNWTRAPDSFQLSQPRASPQLRQRRLRQKAPRLSPLLLWLWQKCGFFPSPTPNHCEDNIVQLKPAGALSCNPIELQQKAWLATTPLLSPSPTHCFPPFFRPSSSFARNSDKDICALIAYFSICLSMLFLSLFQPSTWWDNFYC